MSTPALATMAPAASGQENASAPASASASAAGPSSPGATIRLPQTAGAAEGGGAGTAPSPHGAPSHDFLPVVTPRDAEADSSTSGGSGSGAADEDDGGLFSKPGGAGAGASASASDSEGGSAATVPPLASCVPASASASACASTFTSTSSIPPISAQRNLPPASLAPHPAVAQAMAAAMAGQHPGSKGAKLASAITAAAAAYPILPHGRLAPVQAQARSRLDPLKALLPQPAPAPEPTPASTTGAGPAAGGPSRLNKFVRRLHDMLEAEKNSGIVEWRKGLLVLHSTSAFAKKILPRYFNTKNFKTFRRQLNYYGFVHVRSFSTTGSTTTALWVNQGLARDGSEAISSVLRLRRVEPSDAARTAEGRRVRKEEAASTVEDIGVSTRTLQLDHIRNLALQKPDHALQTPAGVAASHGAAGPAHAPPGDLAAAAAAAVSTAQRKAAAAGGIPMFVHYHTNPAFPYGQGGLSSQGMAGMGAAASPSQAMAPPPGATPGPARVASAANLLLMLSKSQVLSGGR